MGRRGRLIGTPPGEFRVCAAEAGVVWDGSGLLGGRAAGGGGGGGGGGSGGFSLESEHDLAALVTDFLENGSGGGDSYWGSSDSDNGFSDLGFLAEKISFHKHAVDHYESDLLAVIQSLLLSISELDLHSIGNGTCNGSCIRRCLVKLLNVSGYDAALCISKWQGFDHCPGGDHEYVDVIIGSGERFIIDLDFRSHFEIARAVESYNAILKKLPVVYVGTLSRLDQLLQIMVEAARSSLKQNSMPLPPWRSLSYLKAKWHSAQERIQSLDDPFRQRALSYYNKKCVGHLRRLKSSLQFEIEKERLLRPITNDKSWRLKPERRRTCSLVRV